MSSTNKTTYYDLSQYTSNDKPTYLGDYNGDMGKIDAGIHTAKDTADTNATNIGTLSNLTTDTKSSLVNAINEIDSHADTNANNISSLNTSVGTNTGNIGTMLNLETTDKSTLVNAINEVLNRLLNFNLTDFKSIADADFIPTNGTLPTTKDIRIAKNSDGSLAKIYGNIRFDSTNSGGNKILIKNSGLAPSQDITINNAGILRIENYQFSPASFDIVIKTNGDIETVDRIIPSGSSALFIFLPCLYFIKDFGDTPINP